MTLEKLKDNIQWLIELYEINITMIQEDLNDNPFGNPYLIGKLNTCEGIVEHLNDLLDENNYDKEGD